MEQRIDRIEKAIEEMVKARENDRVIIERLDKSIAKHDESLARHDKILANLSANQIVIGKAVEGIEKAVEEMKVNQIVIGNAVEGIHKEVDRMVTIFDRFVNVVGNKFQDHEERINKLEE